MFHTNGASAGGGLVSSSALLLVIVGVLMIFLAHRPIRDWFSSHHTAVREHLYGPEELHVQAMTDHTDTGDDSENEGGLDVEPDDGFDYGIFATSPPVNQ